MNIAAILSNADYEQPRTADELHKWWFAKHEEYGATKEGRIYCREGRGLSKKFYEEAQPLLAYMRAYVSDSSVRCTLSAGSDRADAVLLDKADGIVKSIQITYAIDGYTEHLRMKELTNSGGVDALSKPLSSRWEESIDCVSDRTDDRSQRHCFGDHCPDHTARSREVN